MPTALRQRQNVVSPVARQPREQFSGPRSASYIRGMRYTRQDTNVVALVSGEFYAVPVQLVAGTVYDKMAIYFTVAAVVVARLGVYDAHPNGGIGDLIITFGTVTGDVAIASFQSTAGDANWSVPRTGTYWLVALAEGTMTLRSYYADGYFPSRVTTGGKGMAAGLTKTGVTTGSLPATITGLSLAEECPSVLMRCKSAASVIQSIKKFRTLERAWPPPNTQVCDLIDLEESTTLNYTLANNELTLAPLIIQIGSRNLQIQVSRAVAGTAGTAYMLIYAAGPDNMPDRAVFNQSFTMAAATGGYTITVDQYLAPGLYWVGMKNETTADAVMVGHAPDGQCNWTDSAIGAGSTHHAMGFLATGVVGAPPDPWSGTLTGISTAVRPALFIESNNDDNPAMKRYKRAALWHSLPMKGYYVGGGLPWAPRAATMNFTANTFCIPLFLDRSARLDQIGINIETFSADATYLFGIYSNTRGFQPDRVLLKTGNVAVTGAGDWSAAIDISLSAGVYWLAISHVSGAVDNKGPVGTGWLMMVSGAGGGQPFYLGIAASGLPDPWTAPIQAGTDIIPVIWARIKEYIG